VVQRAWSSVVHRELDGVFPTPSVRVNESVAEVGRSAGHLVRLHDLPSTVSRIESGLPSGSSTATVRVTVPGLLGAGAADRSGWRVVGGGVAV